MKNHGLLIRIESQIRAKNMFGLNKKQKKSGPKRKSNLNFKATKLKIEKQHQSDAIKYLCVQQHHKEHFNFNMACENTVKARSHWETKALVLTIN